MLGAYLQLNWIDIAIAVVMIGAVIVGFIQGVLRLLFASVANYVAFILATQYFHAVGNWFDVLFPKSSDVAADAVGFVFVFVVAQIGLNSLGFTMYRSTRLIRLGVLDQLAGSLIGFALGFVLVSIGLTVLNFAMKTPWVSLESVKHEISGTAATSSLMPMFLAAVPPIAETVKPWLPTGLPSIFYL